MIKIRFTCLGAMLLLLVVAASCSQRSDPVFSRPTRPNVILIVVDSLRADALSYTGYERETSPNIDAFAARSFVFNNAVTVAATTAPALSAIMTGRLPYYTVDTAGAYRPGSGCPVSTAPDTNRGSRNHWIRLRRS